MRVIMRQGAEEVVVIWPDSVAWVWCVSFVSKLKGLDNQAQKLNYQINQYPKKSLIVSLDLWVHGRVHGHVWPVVKDAKRVTKTARTVTTWRIYMFVSLFSHLKCMNRYDHMNERYSVVYVLSSPSWHSVPEKPNRKYSCFVCFPVESSEHGSWVWNCPLSYECGPTI